MKCPKADKLLEAFVAGELGERDAGLIAEHLAACPSCRRKAALCERIDAALSESEAAAVPDGAVAKLMSRLSVEGASRDVPARRAPRASRRLVLTVSSAAAVVLSLLDILDLVDVSERVTGLVRLAAAPVSLASSAVAEALSRSVPALGDAPAGFVSALAYGLLAAAALLFASAGIDVILAERTRRKFFRSAH